MNRMKCESENGIGHACVVAGTDRGNMCPRNVAGTSAAGFDYCVVYPKCVEQCSTGLRTLTGRSGLARTPRSPPLEGRCVVLVLSPADGCTVSSVHHCPRVKHEWEGEYCRCCSQSASRSFGCVRAWRSPSLEGKGVYRSGCNAYALPTRTVCIVIPEYCRSGADEH